MVSNRFNRALQPCLPLLLLGLLLIGCRQADVAPTAVPTETAASPTRAVASPTASSLPPTGQATAASEARPTVQSQEAQQQWREDLDYLVERTEAMHPHFTYRVSPEAFAEAVAGVEEQIAFLTDNQIIVEKIRLLAMSDGHTRLQPHGSQAGSRLYDLQLYQFGEHLYVVDAAESVQKAVGARLVAVGNQDVGDVYEKLSPLVAAENENFVRLYLPLFAVTPEVLRALGIVEEMSRPEFLLERRYAPYAKWLGTAFSHLPLATAATILARKQNRLQLVGPLDPATRPYHGRPFQVLFAGRFAAALLGSTQEETLNALPFPAGAMDQLVDSVLVEDPRLITWLSPPYR